MDRARIEAGSGSPPDGWVTVAKAAAALTDSGDTIDASNVSRYLSRFEEIPSEKRGKFRFVDLAALRRHRGTNILVGEKQAARAIEPTQANPVRPAPADDEDVDEVDASRPVSEVQRANLRLKQLQIRERELDLAEREGGLIPDHEVLALVTGTMETFVEALKREEADIALAHGRETAAIFRKACKAAQGAAARKLAELASRSMPEALAGQVA